MVGSVTLIFAKLLTENHNINALFELKSFAFDFRLHSYICNEIMLQLDTEYRYTHTHIHIFK